MNLCYAYVSSYVYFLNQWFTTQSECVPTGDIGHVWKHFWLSHMGENDTGI